ncbi:hypothetical protein J6590_087026 [Homalodisca vitripennis]|nr:hypothetical protein J6590_087026 [Homalodisca vitripennis]
MEYATDTIFTEVKRMKDVLLDMRAATSRQKSLSTAVRNGMISLESSLDLIDTFWQVWKISMERLQRESREKETQAPSPSMVAVASTTAGKRTAGSPPEHPREEKRQRDAGEPASVDATEESEFRPVVSKKKKRKAKAVDKSGKRQDLPPPPPPQVKKPEKLPRSRPGRQVASRSRISSLALGTMEQTSPLSPTAFCIAFWSFLLLSHFASSSNIPPVTVFHMWRTTVPHSSGVTPALIAPRISAHD